MKSFFVKNFIFISFIFFIFFSEACDKQNNQLKETQQTEFCGGWDTFGEVICECDGKYIKPLCPSGTACDSGKYSCEGVCGICRCYRGPSNSANEIPCNGREEYFQ